MIQSIQTTVDRTVSDMTPRQRVALEELVDGDLAPDQRILVLAYRPGVERSESEESVARNRIDQLLTKAHENAKQQGVPPSEMDAAVAEAIQYTDE